MAATSAQPKAARGAAAASGGRKQCTGAPRSMSRKLEAVLDVFNVMNANTILQAGVLTGSTYNVPTQVLSPRVARLGAKFEF